MNLYEILHITKDATKKVIKEAYRQLSKTHHPDAGGDKEDFSKIYKAYKILIDDKNREKYDCGADVDDLLENKSDRPITIIATVFCQALHSADPEQQDIIEVVNITIKLTIESISKEKDQKELLKKKFNICLKKIKHKDPHNILIQITNNNILNLENKIKEIEEEELHLNEALKIMSDFGYDLEENQLLMDKINHFSQFMNGTTSI